MTNRLFMQAAIDAAWEFQGLTYPNPAVGCIVTQNNQILSISAHQKARTSHAEVLALVEAYENMESLSIDFDKFDAFKAHAFLRSLPKGYFSSVTLYVTLEPCNHDGSTPSCATLLIELGIKKIFIATLDPIEGHCGGAKRLRGCGCDVEIGLLEDKAKELIEPFLIWQKRAFVLFKLAKTLSGDIHGGTISSLSSRTHTHKLRSVCTTMAIGGNTFRVDRPLLDCRLINEKAPNIFVYTKDSNIDRSIPAFGVKSREIRVGDDLSFLDIPSFVLVEGGFGMIEALKHKIDWILFYEAPKIAVSKNESIEFEMNFNLLQCCKKEDDLMIWSRVDG